MGAYHQMGHQTENLVEEVKGYDGVILSPMNVEPAEAVDDAKKWVEAGLDVLLDPQLYFPRSERGHLREWSYFPSDFDTADFSSESWWDGVLAGVAKEAANLNVSRVCSPAIVPATYTNDYYAATVAIADRLGAQLNGSRPHLLTVLARISELADYERVMAIASIASSTSAGGVYLVFQADVVPRLELGDPEQLKGAMRLIRALETSGLRVTIAFTGPEVVLWKAAGATSCATGKFFNLRRFTPGRFDDPAGGGGQLPYWFEESLLASLRESDVSRLASAGLLSATPNNPFGDHILAQMKASPGKSWLALGWRQYMHWFTDVQRRITSRETDLGELLKSAEAKWQALEEADHLMEEVRNNGSWLRPWRRALAEYPKAP
ncbi:MAG: hypothetical protein IPI67_26750 [Myxococcales bacterium]|nr:hypothetical protein [Myxococcales bacterium]